MERFWKYLYNYLFIPLLWLLFHFLALFKKKIRQGIQGRQDMFGKLEHQVERLAAGHRVWFHSSSMGEFEQAKPIIAQLKKQHPDVRVITTFFSPSGYEQSKEYPLSDVTSYLPFDSKESARRFLDAVRPDAAVLVRYDVWPNHIWELQRRRIPTLIANATMRRQTKRRIPGILNFHHYLYNCIDFILTVSQSDADTFSSFSLDHPTIQAIGDTRYDQVSERSQQARNRHIIPSAILNNKRVIVAGSSWKEDEEVIIPSFLKLQEMMNNVLLILVPHEPTIEHLERVERELSGQTPFIRFSRLNEYRNQSVIIVDSIGILLALYASAHIAYIGGSFRQGVHNVLEAAVFGVPVIFGPRHRNSQEPLMLLERGGAFVVRDSEALHRTLQNLLEDESARATAGSRGAQFIQSNTGATARVLQHLEPYLVNHPLKQPQHENSLPRHH
jgi:3-deoxy-D-manno-octulosonic-acid transferase